MAVGEDEAVAVEVVWVCGRIFHRVFPKSDTNCRHSHRTTVGVMLVGLTVHFPLCMGTMHLTLDDRP